MTATTQTNPNERLLKFLLATPEQQAAIDRILEGRVATPPAVSPAAVGAAAAAPEGFITKVELAKRLNRDVRTMTSWMRKGFIPYYRIAHSVVFKWSEVEKQLATMCRVSRPGI